MPYGGVHWRRARLFLVLTNPGEVISPSMALGAIGDGVHVGVCVAVLRGAFEMGASLKIRLHREVAEVEGPPLGMRRRARG